MPDENKTEVKKPVVITAESARELPALYDQLYAREWNRDANHWKNPTDVIRSVFAYGRTAAKALTDFFERHEALRMRVDVLSSRVKALEEFKTEAESQVELAMAQFLEAQGDKRALADVVPADAVDVTPTKESDEAKPNAASVAKAPANGVTVVPPVTELPVAIEAPPAPAKPKKRPDATQLPNGMRLVEGTKEGK